MVSLSFFMHPTIWVYHVLWIFLVCFARNIFEFLVFGLIKLWVPEFVYVSADECIHRYQNLRPMLVSLHTHSFFPLVWRPYTCLLDCTICVWLISLVWDLWLFYPLGSIYAFTQLGCLFFACTGWGFISLQFYVILTFYLNLLKVSLVHLHRIYFKKI